MESSARAWVPRWWRGEGGRGGRVLDVVLLPAEYLYRAGVRLRNHAYDAGWLRAEVPPIAVVSVGNLAVGGAGKTPFAAWLARRLADEGRSVALVLRGYGADEVLVHREINPDVPVFAAARRIEAVRAAAGQGCGIAVVDDGFQHRAMARDVDVVLIAAETWTPSPRLLPRGPWRETVEALRRAKLVVVTRKTASEGAAAEVRRDLSALVDPERIFICHLEPAGLAPLAGPASESLPLSILAGRPVAAVASLADPSAFEQHLRDAGAQVELIAFPDHHDFSAAEAAGLAQRAGERPLVMTRKEAVKLRPLLPPAVEGFVLCQSVTMEDGPRFLGRLGELVAEGGQ